MEKKTLVWFTLVALMLLAACKKAPIPGIERFKILPETERVETGSTTARISGQYEYSGKINGMQVQLATDASMSQPTSFDAVIDEDHFSATLEGLTAATTYHYRYAIDYGASEPYLTETSHFTTLTEAPEVRTLEATSVDASTYRIKCELVSDGGNVLTQCGICWNEYGSPTLADSLVLHQNTEIGTYYCQMSNLSMDKRYHVRAFVKTHQEVYYGEALDFTTEGLGLPVVATVAMGEVASQTAKVLCNVASQGSALLCERGACWSTNPEPTLQDDHLAAATCEVGDYWITMEGLTPQTTYYVRAYATNGNGVAYGDAIAFETTETHLMGLQVTTLAATDIQPTSARVGGIIMDDSGQVIIRRGICWSSWYNPSVDNMTTLAGEGTGSFTVELTDLEKATKIYYRAYVVTDEPAVYGNVTVYGEVLSFFTPATAPSATTFEPWGITGNSAFSGGEVHDNGGLELSNCGLCWSTHPNPTVSDDTVCCGAMTRFTLMMDGLLSNTTYYVRAFAANNFDVGYGEEWSFITSNTPPQPPTVPEGAVRGLFAVSPTEQVLFSQGNLQYQASTDTWRFAEHQYDYIGEDNANVSETYEGWIDLFAFATSGYEHGGGVTQPWSWVYDPTQYYAYGDSHYSLEDQTGQADWGYNAISNGGNQIGQWRTLTSDEFCYLLYQRPTGSGLRFCKAIVDGTNGVILFPQSWIQDYYPFVSYNESVSYSMNVLTLQDWELVESYGAVFLPAAGFRYAYSINEVNWSGNYWCSTPFFENGGSPDYAGADCFAEDYSGGCGYGYRCIGYSVRLVRDVERR